MYSKKTNIWNSRSFFKLPLSFAVGFNGFYVKMVNGVNFFTSSLRCYSSLPSVLPLALPSPWKVRLLRFRPSNYVPYSFTHNLALSLPVQSILSSFKFQILWYIWSGSFFNKTFQHSFSFSIL